MAFRKFVHANGAKMAMGLSKEAIRGLIFAACVAGSFKYFIDYAERSNITKYYKVPQVNLNANAISDNR